MPDIASTPPPRRLKRRLSMLTAVAALGLGGTLVARQTGAFAGATVAAKIMAVPPAPTAPKAEIPFESYKLDNGLEVILVPDRTVPLVAVDVWYHVGSGLEVPGKSGFAHLFEHMLFQGSRHVGSDRHFDLLKQAGASGVNGSTNSDRTNYYEVLPSNQLELALWMESDRMGYLLDLLTEESLANQRDVVRNERRERYDNVPYGVTRFAIAHALYPEGHPYRDMTIGKHEDLERASVDDVANFFRTWYVPANATLTIAGDFDPKTIRASIQQWFGSFPTSVKPTVVPVPPPASRAQRLEVSDPFAKLQQIAFVWLSPAMMASGDAELDIAADALMREGTGRLDRILVQERGLAQSVVAYQWGSGFSGQFQIAVTLRSGADVKVVESIIRDEVQKLATEPLSARELERAVTGVEAGTIRSLEGLMERAERLQTYNHYWGDPGGLDRDLARYTSATVEGVRQQVATTLDLSKAVVVITTPAPAATTGGAP